MSSASSPPPPSHQQQEEQQEQEEEELMPWEITANPLADRRAVAKRAVAEPEKEKGNHHRRSPEKLKLRRKYQDVMDQQKYLAKKQAWLEKWEERTTAINGDAVELALDAAETASQAAKLSSRQTKLIQPLMLIANEAKDCARSLLARPFLPSLTFVFPGRAQCPILCTAWTSSYETAH